MAQPHEELLDSMLPERILGHLGLSLLLSPGDQIVDFAPFRKEQSSAMMLKCAVGSADRCVLIPTKGTR